MRRVVLPLLFLMFYTCSLLAQDDGWENMFNGKNLLGWHVNENPDSFSVEDGCIVLHGKRGHAFYVGPTGNTDLTNFHFNCLGASISLNKNYVALLANADS